MNRECFPRVVLGVLLLVWVATFFVYPPNGSAYASRYPRFLAEGDGYYIYLNTISLVYDWDVDLTDEYAYFGDPWRLGERTTSTGRAYVYPIGTALLQAPALMLASGVVEISNLFGASLTNDGYSLLHHRFVFLTNLLAGFGALVLGYGLAERSFGRNAALYAAMVVGLGSSLYFYGTLWVSYPHVWTAFAVASLLDYWDRTKGRDDVRRYATLGALIGFCALTRMQALLFGLAPAIEGGLSLLHSLRNRDGLAARRLAVAGTSAGGACLLVLSPQLLHTALFHGSPFAVPQGPHYMDWSTPFFWEVLFASNNGLLWWTPLLWMSLLGLLAALRRLPTTAAALMFLFLLQVWVNGSAYDYHGSWGFGQRRLVGCTAIYVFGAAAMIAAVFGIHRRWPRIAAHAAFCGFLAPMIVVNMELANSTARGRVPVGVATRGPAPLEGAVHRILHRIHRAVGNPSVWPYNLLWAARHRVSPARYDELVGAELLYFDFRDYERPGHTKTVALRMESETLRRYGAGGWRGHDGWIAERQARLLVPLFVHRHLSLGVAAQNDEPLTVLWNGQSVGSVPATHEGVHWLPLPARRTLRGTNELVVSCDGSADQSEGCAQVRELRFRYRVPRHDEVSDSVSSSLRRKPASRDCSDEDSMAEPRS
ncbi:MAG: hypothetical protein ACFB9M_07295 [Myxococcota bacterium]